MRVRRQFYFIAYNVYLITSIFKINNLKYDTRRTNTRL